jgi:DNA-directed RNA polymerase beta subunit
LFTGSRLGEMEHDCLIAYGARMLIFERLLFSNVSYKVQVIPEVVRGLCFSGLQNMWLVRLLQP